MDGYDLFRKLSKGAKFDFNRFRSDAEKLHIIRPSLQSNKHTGQKNSITGNNEGKRKRKRKRKNSALSESKGQESDSDTESESESGINSVATQYTDRSELRNKRKGNEKGGNNIQDQSDESDSSSSSDDDADDDDNDDDNKVDDGDHISEKSDEDKSSDSESDNELHILGEMKSSSASKIKEERKKRKLERKKSEKTQAEFKKEEINLLRKKSNVHVYGTDVPEPIENFEVLQTKYNIHKYITRNIEAVGYKTPTPIQLQAIPVMLNNRDILACAPTGSGKTAAFIIPILHHLKEPRNVGVRALALAPTRELAKQTYREFQRLSEGMGFRIGYVDKVGSDLDRVKKLFKKSDIMVSTPNRLVHLLEQTPPLVSLTSVKWLVVDESDKLFEDGKTGFRDQLATIYKCCDGSARRAMFSATFTHDVEQWCKLNLDNVVQVYIGEKNRATHTVEQSLLFCGSEHGKLLAIREIIRKGIDPPVLVFVQSKERAKELFHELIYDGMNVDVIHAERTQTQRDNVVKCFRSGKIWILICTELMGRGIDFKGVNLVINYDFPNSSISYIHRIGRTGRAGRPGKAVTFFTEDDGVFLRSIAGVMKSAGCPVPDYMINMKKPNKQFRKKMAKTSLSRATISTAPGHQRKRTGGFMVKKSKHMKGKSNKRKRSENSDSNIVKRQKTGESTPNGFISRGKSKKQKQFGKNKSFKQKGDNRKGKQKQKKKIVT